VWLTVVLVAVIAAIDPMRVAAIAVILARRQPVLHLVLMTAVATATPRNSATDDSYPREGRHIDLFDNSQPRKRACPAGDTFSGEIDCVPLAFRLAFPLDTAEASSRTSIDTSD
jgi:hypothetical protein